MVGDYGSAPPPRRSPAYETRFSTRSTLAPRVSTSISAFEFTTVIRIRLGEDATTSASRRFEVGMKGASRGREAAASEPRRGGGRNELVVALDGQFEPPRSRIHPLQRYQDHLHRHQLLHHLRQTNNGLGTVRSQLHHRHQRHQSQIIRTLTDVPRTSAKTAAAGGQIASN